MKETDWKKGTLISLLELENGGRTLEDARFENDGRTAVPVSKKQEVLRLLPFSFLNQTDRGAIRPHHKRNMIGVRKDIISRKTASFLSAGLNTPLFFHTLHRSRM